MTPRRCIPPLGPDDRIRFFGYVDRSGDCWVWTAGCDRGGYGRFHLRGRKYAAHRVSYHFFHGIPAGTEDLDHLCRNRACVRPDHLEPVSHRENVGRGQTGSHFSERTHCANGHAYDAENTRWARDRHGVRYRICRTCSRTYTRQHRARLRQKEVSACR